MYMKKIFYILPIIILAAGSCAREEYALEPVDAGDKKVSIVMSLANSVILDSGTKATAGMEMGDNPAIKNIHVAVFGSSGYLQEYVSAVPCDAQGRQLSGFASSNGVSSYFLVRLSLRSKQSQVHIIANGPSSLSYNAYENTLMQGLRTSNGNGAYWARINLPLGIRAVTTTNSDGDVFYQEDGNGEYIPTEETRNAFKDIVLVRNFAGISVRENNIENFDLISFTVCNMPSEGSVAIYSASHDGWVTGYEEKANESSGCFDSTTGLISWDGKVYPGFPENPTINGSDIPATEAQFNAAGMAVPAGQTKYVYERAVTNSLAPFVLIAGRYKASGVPDSSTPIQYYRLDITKNDDYVPFYRNFKYVITLSGVTVAGYDTPAEAALHNSGDNFSISLDTSTLPDVSDGTTRMYVETTTIDMLYTDETQDVWYQFFKTDGTAYLNENVTVTEKEGGNAIVFSNPKVTYDNTENKGYFHFTVNEPATGETLESTVRLVGTYAVGGSDSKLSREVKIRVFNKQDMSLGLSPDTVAPFKGEVTTLSISIPKTLTWSMFPMEFAIEDSNKSLNPTEDVPVRTDVLSIVPGHETEPSYQFVYTLNWEEYNNLLEQAERAGDTGSTVTFDVPVKTIKTASATTVYVANKYFNTASIALLNDASNLITPSTQTISGTSATVYITADGRWSMAISRSNGSAAAGATLSTYGGSYGVTNQAINVTLPENEGGNDISYTVRLINNSVDPNIIREATIIQKGKSVELSYYNNTTSIAGAGGSFSVNVSSEVDYSLSVLDAGGNVVVSETSYTAEYPSTSRRYITIPANETVENRTLTVRLSNSSGSIVRELPVTQYAGTAVLTITDAQIRASETSATVRIQTTMATVLKLYDSGNNLLYTSNQTASTAGRDVELTGIPVNSTSSTKTYRVDLCNSNGTVLRTGAIVQLAPTVDVTASASSIKGNVLSMTVHVEADVDWTMTVQGGAGGAVFASNGSTTVSGNATGASGADYTITLPINRTTSNREYYVSISGSGITKEASFIHRAATVLTGQQTGNITVNRTNFDASGNTVSNRNNATVDADVFKITLSTAPGNNQSYAAINRSNGSVAFEQLSDDYEVTFKSISQTYTASNYAPSSMTYAIGSGTSQTLSGSGTSWPWSGSAERSITFNPRRSGINNCRLTTIAVTYDLLYWE